MAVYEGLNILRVYTKIPGKKADLNSPFTMQKGSTVQELATHIHKDFLEKLKYARVWNSQGLNGQMVERDYILQEGDVVELHM
jgi:ribosome-interacting GTPase 1